jgi:23S rRNA (adenine2503-C2)-methyltransferase
VAKQHRLDDLRTAILEMQTVSNRSVMLEYLLLAGLNDSPADADSLVEWTTGMNVHLNLIPFNTIAGAPHLVGSSRPTREAFANRLKSAGRTTTLRYSMGSDIAAACGQLVQKLDRAGARISPAANELLVQ